MGADRITFLFSPGEPLQPMTAIASGGDESLSPGAQSLFSQVDAAGTLVFDEIDVGFQGE